MAEEVAEASWARGWQCRAQLLKPNSVEAWVTSIARMYLTAIKLEQRFEELVDSAPPNTLMHSLEAAGVMRICSELESKMLTMFYIEGYTTLEITQREELCPATVRVRLMRIRRSLRDVVSSGALTRHAA